MPPEAPPTSAVVETENSATIEVPSANRRRTITQREAATVQAPPAADPPAADPQPPPAESVTAPEPETVKPPKPETPEPPIESKTEEPIPIRDFRVKAEAQTEQPAVPGEPVATAPVRDQRIDLFYKQQKEFRETQERLRQLEEQIAASKTAPTPAVTAPSPATAPQATPEGRPKWVPENYEKEVDGLSGYDRYVEELAEWKTAQAVQKLEEKLKTQAVHDRAAADANKRMTAWQQKIQAAQIPDYDAVITASTEQWKSPNGAELNLAILDMDHGPEVAYHLATNPAEVRRIDALPRHKQFAELAKLDEQYSKPPVQDTPAVPVQNRLPEGASHADPPIRPLRSTSTNPVLDPLKIAGASPDGVDFRKFVDVAGIQVQKGRFGGRRN